MADLLDVRNLKIEFHLPQGRIEAVKDVSFRVRAGSTVAIVGESGSGKSVVSQSIMGILPQAARISGGQILFQDVERGVPVVDIAALNPQSAPMQAIRGGRISMIFQEPMTSLSPLHTVGNQICEALHLHRKVGRAEGRELVRDMLRLVNFPDPAKALNSYSFELSGGLRQRAMIAMALVCRPALLIADEPTTALDVTIQAQILKLLKDLQKELGMAVLLITHDLGVVANLAEEVVVMHQGDVLERGQLDDIFYAPGHPYLKALLNAVPRFAMKPGERLTPLREITHETGHLLAERTPWPDTADPDVPLLSVAGVSKSFGARNSAWFKGPTAEAVAAVRDVSFTIRRGECLGLVGESGCGKTTLSKIIMRAVTPETGAITFNDRGTPVDVRALRDDGLLRYRRNLQYIFQDPFSSLNPRMTVFDIIREPLVIHRIGDAGYQAEMVAELMRLVGLDARFLNRYPHSFSGGQRQRIGIARALALKPDMLLCDEPVSALDVSIQAQVLNLLKDLKSELGLTYLFVSHNLAVVDYMADRIAVMCAGQLVEIAPRETLFQAARHPYTRALLAAVPEPSPARKLDLGQLHEDRDATAEAWPEPFATNGEDPGRLIDMGGGHFVRATNAARIRELAS